MKHLSKRAAEHLLARQGQPANAGGFAVFGILR